MEEAPVAWSKLQNLGDAPTKRSGHSLTTLKTAASEQVITGFLFGGVNDDRGAEPSNDLYKFQLNTSDINWSKVTNASGRAPCPRWRHTAIAISESQMMIFGGMENNSSRLNDVFIYDAISNSWSQPEGCKGDRVERPVVEKKSSSLSRNSEADEKRMDRHGLSAGMSDSAMMNDYDIPVISMKHDSTTGAPSPRGAHSAVVIGEYVYIFGGYGGYAYGRHDLNDLYRFHIPTLSWHRIEAGTILGTLPPPRSGHIAVAVNDNTMLIQGGWNSTTQFNDLWSFNVEKMTWTCVSEDIGGPSRSNASALAVKAVPNSQVFIFGGISRANDVKGPDQGSTYLNNMLQLNADTLEVNDMSLQHPQVWENAPKARAETAMFYDRFMKRVVIFGGWRHRWLQDSHALCVAPVVGPPYAILSLEPSIGPITGEQQLRIGGMGFRPNEKSHIVRFIAGRKYIDQVAEAVSETELKLTSPSFEQFGPGTFDVRMYIKGESFLSITSQKYSFFNVTNAAYSFAFGHGILSKHLPNQTVEFMIQARDTANTERQTGGDEFVVTITRLEDFSGPLAEAQRTTVANQIKDLGTGQYLVSYTLPGVGKYSIDVSFEGTFKGIAGTIRGSPFIVSGVESLPKQDPNAALLEHTRDLIERASKTASTTYETVVKTEVPHSNLDLLLMVKNTLSNIPQLEPVVRLQLDEAAASLLHLRAAGAAKPRDLDALSKSLKAAETNWDVARKESPKCRATIAPLVKVHSINTRKEIEQFAQLTEQYVQKTLSHKYYRLATGQQGALEALAQAETAHAEHLRLAARIAFLAKTFEFPQLTEPIQARINTVAASMTEMRRVWGVNLDVENYIRNAKQVLWSSLNPAELEEGAKALQKRLKSSSTPTTRDSDTVKGLDKILKNFLSVVPLIASLRHPSMRPRHWEMLMTAAKKQFTPPYEDPDMKLQNLLDLELHEQIAVVEEIYDQAREEGKMEDTLGRLESVWSSINWLSDPYSATSDVKLLKMSEEDFEALESDQLAVQGMLSSRYLAVFEEAVTKWHRELGMVSDVVLLLIEIQRKWAYLEPLFIASEEVRNELPEAAADFAETDKVVKNNLKEMLDANNVKAACNREGLFKELETIAAQLDKCERALAEFLNGKRRAFPRFYFVSKSDLLDILSNGSNPRKIMHHVNKVFLQTDTLTLTEAEYKSPTTDAADVDSGLIATKWNASVGVEEVEFEPPVSIRGKVERYLQTLLDGQRATLRATLGRSVDRYPRQQRIEWLMNKVDGKPSDPAQISLLVAGMAYVQGMEEAFQLLAEGDPHAMKNYFAKAEADLADLVRLTMTNLSKPDRTRVMCMITLDAHGRDIIQKMILENVTEKSAFQWQSQLKQRWIDKQAKMHIADARMDYSYEYLGNGPRLVVTPLTDRIYVTATQALNLKMGCAPAGPAGTGKTETTKDLANALAITCYVFNCAPEMDYTSLGNIFKGLAASGSWGCFDEFNRLVPEVLSVCSVQFKAVCDGIRAQRTSVVIEGDEVNLLWTAGAFITMNPGYLGRSELPEGLKSLFRPITVMVPDLVLICENMLMAEGFIEAKILASKFYSLYSLLRELLSKQSHYDWGLRAIKSVLVVAGSFKRAEPDIPEQALLMRALRDFNIPKIVKQDEVVFFGLLGDLFPGISPSRKVDPALEAAVTTACTKRGLDPDEFFRLKVVQLEELLAIRHCVFVMGPPAAGKSECWKVLQTARGELGRKTKVLDLDPKAVTPLELYGYIHPATREWKDGLLSKIMRDLGTEPGDDPKWILLDGDLDANWIESMNSVMDDNKMLTLASNERIPLKGHMRMVFEIRDLNHATPATVSRAGIIFISTNLGTQWRSLLKSWLLKFPVTEPIRDIFRGLFDRYCAPTLLFIKKSCSPLVPVEDVTLVTNLLRLLKTQFNEALLKKLNDPALPLEEAAHTIETYFVFCAIWAFGSALSVRDGEDYRVRFSEFWRSEFNQVRLPSRDTVFDHWLDPESLRFDSWTVSPLFSSVEFNSKTMQMSQLTVPTAQTSAITFWMEKLVAQRDPVMLVGFAGTGKTQLINGLLNRQDTSKVMSQPINFNFYTDSKSLQLIMEGPLEKKTGTNYGPPGKAQLIYYLDDFNLPEVDAYDTQSAIALVRQLFDYSHWYDRQKLQLRNLLNCQFLSSMNPTAGSFNVNPRMQRHFFSVAVGFPSVTDLHTIYETFLKGHLVSFSEEVRSAEKALMNAAVQLHASVTSTFRKSAQNFHYEFNIRHLTNVFQGILTANAEQFPTQEKVAQLWLHESERVYGDRLVSLEDLNKYRVLAAQNAKKRFPSVNLGNFFGEHSDPLVFCHFADGLGDRVYNRVSSMDTLKKTLEDALREYNETLPAMNLVLFEDAMKHVCRISRIILNPSGHALLVGVGGSGKQSLSRLASFICDYRVYQITISGTYGLNDLKEDLKAMYNIAGVKDEGVSFLFTDSQITNEKFLVSMNDLLASGNVPDLFAPEEVDTISNAMVARVKAEGIVPDKVNCWNYFIRTVQRNLHVILCFSPVGEDFRTRAKRFPALVNCTVIDWFQPWPKDALLSVGQKFLADIEDIPDNVRERIEQFMPFSFESVNEASIKYRATDRRYVYTTPKSFLELLKLYKSLLQRKREESDSAISRLANGLTKLRETGEVVARIEEELKIQNEAAEIKRATSSAIAEDVAQKKAVVEDETEKANVIAETAASKAATAKEIKESAERDLAAAGPLVESAKAALGTLNIADLQTLKTMSTPPKGLDQVFIACMVILAGVYKPIPVGRGGKVAEKDRSWDVAKKTLLGDIPSALSCMESFKDLIDAGSVPAVNFSELGPYLKYEPDEKDKKPAAAAGSEDSEESDFVRVMTIKNKTAGGLAKWVDAINKYYEVFVTVEPKRLRAQQATEETEIALADKAAAEEKVRVLTENLRELEINLAAAEKDRQEADAAVERGRAKADLANRLTNALADENVRWAASIELLRSSQLNLIGDVLLASSFISYIGPFTKQYRDILMREKWVPFLTEPSKALVPMSPSVDPLKVLTTEAQVAQWNADSLPDDKVSVENGAIVTSTARWPLMIDPQLQGITWVRQREQENGLIVVRLEQKDMLRNLKNALQKGLPVLIENMGEKIDAVLGPILSRSLIKKGNRYTLKLGDDEIDYNPKFRLYMHTKLSNPHYPPEVQAEACLVNFTVTEVGLEDQLLAVTVARERPDLAAVKKQLIRDQNSFKIKMGELEDGILKRLAEAEGDLTEDRALIEGLEETKRIANDITERQEIAKNTEFNINVTSEKYRPVAHRAALLFFLMNSLFKVHTYYKYSLNAFVGVFLRSMEAVPLEYEEEESELDLESDAVVEPSAESSESQSGAAADAEPASEAEAAEAPASEAAAAEVSQSESAAAVESTPDVVEESKPPQEQRLKQFTDEQLSERCTQLMSSATSTAFRYIVRGMFERDKLAVATQLCLKLQLDSKELTPELFHFLVVGPTPVTDAGSPGELSDWVTDSMWSKIKGLEAVKPVFEKLGDDVANDSSKFRAWFDDEAPELNVNLLPGEYKQSVQGIYLLLLLRALRPDRLVAALQTYISNRIGSEYVVQPAFDMEATFAESSRSTPTFFVLFPGVDPTVWVENLGRKLGFTYANNKFVNISMGQGQEAPAMALLKQFSETGGWIMLQNVHLMQSWLPLLERQLEIAAETAHADFRCFISAEPPPLSYMDNVPESLMQSCIKVANEAPADLLSNLTRSWGSFSKESVENSLAPVEYKACLFALTWYHSIVLGRRRFGQQGWSRKYSFNTGDLTVCANVLNQYINSSKAADQEVPLSDLRYIFGEIMYGGHITDAWDRRTNNTYLQVYMQPDLFTEKELGPGFRVPKFSALELKEADSVDQNAGLTYDEVNDYIRANLPKESPPAFGLHPNAEIGFLTAFCDDIFSTIQTVGGASSSSSSVAGGSSVRSKLEDLLARLPEPFQLIDLEMRASKVLEEPHGPFVIVVMQECERMNALLNEIKRSLTELKKGLEGSLNMSESMEDLSFCLSTNLVPGRNPFHKCNWEKYAWASRRTLSSWFVDLLNRMQQLSSWSETLVTPLSLWLPGLFNPMAILTAIQQVTARATGLPLDKMAIDTHVTTYKEPGEVTAYPEHGLYVHGLFIEGARWHVDENEDSIVTVGTTPTNGYISDSKLKQLLPQMPVIYLRAVPVQNHWIPSSVGFLRNDPTVYECPVYLTTFRGPTYVFLATLKSLEDTSKWTLAGCALIMQPDE